ncbi:MAG: RNA polymerase sigma factor [Deltaproteobacteria bacterium]|nr:RNA polymerase sigma factor [Deltaproteobacteria bacterium]
MPLTQQDAIVARFEAVFEAELGYVWTSLRRLGVQPRDLEDVAHEVFLKAYGAFASYDPTRPIRPWLFAFAFRLASDYRRLARHRTSLYGDEDPAADDRPDAEQALLQRQREELVSRALESLEMDRRAVFVLHELDEQPMPVVAEMLGIPLNTGYSRLRTAREEFSAAVRRLDRTLTSREKAKPENEAPK